MSYYELVVLSLTCCCGPLLNIQFHPDSQRRRTLGAWRQPTMLQLWLWYTSWTINTYLVPLFYVGTYDRNEHLKYRHLQRQKYLTSTESCYFMPLSDKLSYLLDSIMLLSQIIATVISAVKCERNNLPFTIEAFLQGEFNWNVYEITQPCYAINACILYRLCFKQYGFLQ